MADYIYMLESRLSPEQQRALAIVQQAAQAHGINLYLTGGAIRDIITGFAISDLDLTTEGSPFRLLKDLEKAGGVVQGSDEELAVLYVLLPGNVRAAINQAHSETFPKPGQ